MCTEVIYRAYQGIGQIEFELSQRAGRPSLSAEDILGLALSDRFFDVVALISGQYTQGKVLEDRRQLWRCENLCLDNTGCYNSGVVDIFISILRFII